MCVSREHNWTGKGQSASWKKDTRVRFGFFVCLSDGVPRDVNFMCDENRKLGYQGVIASLVWSEAARQKISSKVIKEDSACPQTWPRCILIGKESLILHPSEQTQPPLSSETAGLHLTLRTAAVFVWMGIAFAGNRK